MWVWVVCVGVCVGVHVWGACVGKWVDVGVGVFFHIIHNGPGRVYMENRNIGKAIRVIDDMISHCLTSNINCFLIAVDLEKAFDSISHSFLSSVLKWFGFGPSFCSWVNTIYTNISSCVMNGHGGFSTGYFKRERGVRQGDPLSPYLFFFIIIEILTHTFRRVK